MIKTRLLHSCKCRGFTLTELALVLLVAGVVISAIWVAGQHVWDNYRVYRVTQQMMYSSQNIRDHYGNSVSSWPWAAGTDVTSTFDQQGLIPVEMRRDPYAAPGGSAIDHALNNTVAGGSFHILTENNVLTGQLNAFRIQLLGVSKAACVKLLLAAPLSDGSVGFLVAGTQSTVNVINNGALNGDVTAEVISPDTANTWCDSASNNNEVDFDLKLHN